MATLTPRASGLWTSYFDADVEDGMDDAAVEAARDSLNIDGLTPLDRTIDRIGMGSYQWILLSLCGFGWMADNMWIEAVAISLGRIQRHFSVSDRVIGALPSSMQAGMMVGALGWGACSDLLGRTAAFNATLVLTALFGAVAAFAPSFGLLCGALLLLGSAVGGSMPTDGTLLLEYVPRQKGYLVTALSVFFSVGAVLAAAVALVVIPGHSCAPAPAQCDPARENGGWRLLLGALALLTTGLFAARVLFFTLHESPRFLVRAGRPAAALDALTRIAHFNGSPLVLELADVRDAPGAISHAGGSRAHEGGQAEPAEEGAPFLSKGEDGEAAEDDLEEAPPVRAHPVRMASSTGLFDAPGGEVRDYATVTPPAGTPTGADANADVPPARPRPPRTRLASHRPSMLPSRASYRGDPVACAYVPRALRAPLAGWMDRVALTLEPDWRRTTVLVWAAWFAMSFAFTMFNVYLPKLLESAGPSDGDAPRPIAESLWDIVIFTLGGCPGALVGAWLVDMPAIGRRRALAGSTFATAACCAVFAGARAAWAVRASTLAISLFATTMYAVLYGWTPEIFETEMRGTACGIASALSRIGGMFAPLVGGLLLAIDRALPVYASVVIFFVAGLCVLLIPEQPRRLGKSDGATFVH